MGTNPINVMLGHQARAGKDTLAALIVERNGHYRRAFGDAVKEEVGCMLLGYMANERTRLIAWQFVESQKHRPEMRLLLQAYGDGKRELVSQRYWIDQVLGYMEMFRAGELLVAAEQHAGIVIPDARYPNEVRTGLAHEFLCIDLWRPGAEALEGDMGKHRSETALKPQDFPFMIVNDGTPGDMLMLYDRAVQLFRRPDFENPSNGWPHILCCSDAAGIAAARHLNEFMAWTPERGNIPT